MTVLMVALGDKANALSREIWLVLLMAAFILRPRANRVLRRSSTISLPEECIPPES